MKGLFSLFADARNINKKIEIRTSPKRSRALIENSFVFLALLDHSVHPPPFLLWERGGGGGLKFQPNFQKGGLGWTSTFRGGDFFQGGLQFSHKK